MALIIVESPTKARTFNKILKDSDYYVFATMGHIRDLPANKLAIDYKNNFKPDYYIIKNKERTVSELKNLASKNKEIILATDPDREGESIAYHVAYLLGKIKESWPEAVFVNRGQAKRIVFHEITSSALKEALDNPMSIRLDLVKAQQARRIVDRIVGYELSPLLWKKIGKNWLSAGRVQTVALRLIVEREKEIEGFKTEDYFQILGLFTADNYQEGLQAKLISKDGIAYEQKFSLNLFAGLYQYGKTTIDANNVDTIKKDLSNDSYSIFDVKESVQNRYPPPPFTTSLLQQEAFHRFGFSSKQTMKLAQDLYEHGLITYHRTDSFNLSTQFVFLAKKYIKQTYGADYALDKPRLYKTKSRVAQEAHEAIRSTGAISDLSQDKNQSGLSYSHAKLYRLIFDRAVATQMKEARIKSIKIIIDGSHGYRFVADSQKVLFDGFLKLLNPEFVKNNQTVPNLVKAQLMLLQSVKGEMSTTKPPPRYNEASLIKTLEEKGIGRPSTYAPIISLIQDKYYIEKENRYFIPTKLGRVISDYLSQGFPDIFNLDFTASMEKGLDDVAQGQENFIKLLKDFNRPFQEELIIQKNDKKVIDVEEEVKETCPNCGSKLVVRYSKFGKFLACSRYPNCKFTKSFLHVVPNKFCPQCNGKIIVKYTKSRKKFFGCENYPKCDYSTWRLN